MNERSKERATSKNGIPSKTSNGKVGFLTAPYVTADFAVLTCSEDLSSFLILFGVTLSR